MFRSLFMVHAYMHHFFLSPLLSYPAGCQILKAWVPQQGVGHQPAVAGLLPLYNRLVTDRTWYAESSRESVYKHILGAQRCMDNYLTAQFLICIYLLVHEVLGEQLLPPPLPLVHVQTSFPSGCYQYS